ncbi:hypothetical protein BD289DRAFT_437975 [Coniella lustricola]|uniref:Uncharacterized protein n=1 Tax=Coniella lustricola TaxID=2025994 RepID=A0A2T3A3H5_9PEZI|nr:hypothetical protein BD289DRAFT_437975 [Coniella lustricola]
MSYWFLVVFFSWWFSPPHVIDYFLFIVLCRYFVSYLQTTFNLKRPISWRRQSEHFADSKWFPERVLFRHWSDWVGCICQNMLTISDANRPVRAKAVGDRDECVLDL